MRKNNDGSKFMLVLMLSFVGTVALIGITAGMISVFFETDPLSMLVSPWVLIATQLVGLMLPLTIWMIAKKESVRSNFPSCDLGAKNIIIIVALSFLIQPVIMTISGIMSLFVDNDVASLMYSLQRQPFWLSLIAIAVMPAICEELVFRGYIQSKYRDRPIRRAALINGLFFGIIHLNFHQFTYAFLLGVAFAYMVHYTRSIWAAIIPHFIINGTQLTLSRLAFMAADAQPYADPAAEELFASLALSPEALAIIIFGILALFLSPVIVILFIEFFKHNKARFAGYEESPVEAVPSPVDEYGYAYQADNVAVPDNIYREAPQEFLHGMHYKKPSRVDPYAIAVVVIFVVIAVLMLMA